MDRISIIGLVLCLVLYFAFQAYVNKTYPEPKPHSAASAPSAVATSAPNGTPSTTAPNSARVPVPTPAIPEQISYLENNAIKVRLTSHGAAIEEIELKQHKSGLNGNIILNQQAHSNVLALAGWNGAGDASFQVTEKPPGSVIYSTDLPNGLKWQRAYVLGADYAFSVADNFTNPATADVTLPTYSLSVGRAEPLHDTRSSYSNMQFLGAGFFGHEFHLVNVGYFNPGFIPLIGIMTHEGKDLVSSTAFEAPPLRWLGVENQFFTILLTPPSDHPIDYANIQCFNQRDGNGSVPTSADPDIEAAAWFPALTVPAGHSVSIGYTIYAGPKEYYRLKNLGAQQGEIMNYGWCEPVILLMLFGIQFWHGLVGSYGLSIMLLTLTVKLITWPLVSVSNHTGKRMQALAPKIKEVQAKYKDQPEKISAETWTLYRDYGVNPLGGCLPALVQAPIFISLYYMLQSLTELRGQSFLWIHDLTQPDTVATIAFAGTHFTLNLLPILVTALSMVMMRMTPQIGDPAQAKIAQYMPLMFLFIFYNFAAALSLYYVINNCVAIVQIYRNLKKPLPELKRVPRRK
ncbi:MAG TPA: membrane protein insertase YidC [Candidatus Methylacidiphilales bacterium]|nr:membrane protein insertase YidC [Candidatus Methylacidiphilales bacterium]